MKEDYTLITGASSGIGEAVAYRLARRGDCILLNGRDQIRLDDVSGRCRELGARRVVSAAGDLCCSDAFEALIGAIDGCEPILRLVNAAGVGRFSALGSVSDDVLDDIIGTNLRAVFRVCREVARRMKCTIRRGTIVNISSDADTVGFEGAAAYCASKGGVLAMSRALRLELRSQGIQVCVVSPGRVDTRFNGKRPGARPGALAADEVAEVVEFILYCSPNIELQEVRLDSMSRLG